MPLPESKIASHRPATLYFYGDAGALARAWELGEFRLQPLGHGPNAGVLPSARQILPFGRPLATSGGGFLTLSLSSALRGAGEQSRPVPCLVIRQTEEFGERLHRAVQQALPQWAGIDAAVAYGAPSPLGVVFSKARHLAREQEWLFAWRPIQPLAQLAPLVVRIGKIDQIAQLQGAPDAEAGPQP